MATPYSKHSPGKYCLWIDWETTGADFGTGESAKRYQGISYGAVIADTTTFEPVETLYRELKFDSSKYAWTDGAEKIHGLSRKYLEANGVTREEGLIDLLELISKYIGAGNKICLGGHNVKFDQDFTAQLANDHGVPLDWHHVVLDTSSLGFVAIGEYKSDKVFAFFGGEKRGKHNALDDALQSLAVARGIKQLVQAALS